MYKRQIMFFLFIVLAVFTYGQEKKSSYKALQLHSFSESEYPLLCISFDYFSLTDVPDSVTLFENGHQGNILSISDGEISHTLKMHFLSLYSDTVRISPFIRKLESFQQPGLISDLVVSDDSVLRTVKPYEWLKNKLTGTALSDTVLLSELLKNCLSEFHRPEDILVIIAGKSDDGYAEFINNSLKRMAGDNPPFFIFLYEKSKTKEGLPVTDLNDSLRIGISQFDPSKSDPSIILPFLSPLISKSKTVKWKTSDPLSLLRQRNIRVKVNDVSTQMSVFLIDSIIKKFFIQSTLYTADSLIKEGEYRACMSLLNDRYLLLEVPEFAEKAELNLDSLAANLISKKDNSPFSSFIALESLNRLPLSKDFQSDKIKRVKEFYRFVDNQDAFYDERLKIAEYLFMKAPEDNEANFMLHWSKGKAYDSAKNFWKALDEYQKALSLRDEVKVRSEIKKLLNISLPAATAQRDWKQVRLYGSRFYDFIKTSFSLRCLYGRACYEIADYQTSISESEWLLFNWQDNNCLTWEEAFINLQNAYTLSFRFDDAISLCQRIFREKKNIESLNLALLNLRLKWLKPAIDAFNIWLESAPDNLPDGSVNFARIGFPQYLLSVRICESAGSNAKVLFRNPQLRDLNANIPLKESTAAAIYLEDTYQWLTGKTYDKRQIVFQLDNNKMDDQEKLILGAINKEPANNQIWHDLFAYEEKNGLRSLTQLMAALVGSSLQLSGSTNADKYWSAISGNKGFLYISNLKKDGSVYYQKGFERKKSAITEEDFQKSVKTTAFYLMETKYDNDGVFDITNPVFGRTGWEGSLRIGVIKQY